MELYMNDAYKREFRTKVASVNGLHIIFESTAFYPTGGGQPHDTGVIVGSNNDVFVVKDVRKSPDGIVHEVDKNGLMPGDEVLCKINWERRYMLMRMHTAAHMLASVVSTTGALVTGKQLEEDESRIDFSIEEFNKEIIEEFVSGANRLISQGATVKTCVLPREEALKIEGMVKLAGRLPPLIPELRIVEIENIDVQACGGTHVRNIREIGRIEFTKAENKGKTNRRLYYKVIN